VPTGCGLRHVETHYSGYCRDQILDQLLRSGALYVRGAGGHFGAIDEKLVAFAAAQEAAERALAEGLGIYEAAEQAYLPLRHRVRANSERLRVTTD
jgi:hypothetical protein